MRKICCRNFVSPFLVTLLVAWSISGVRAEPDTLAPFAGTEVSQDELCQTLATSPSRQFKPLGRSSAFFRMRTTSRVTAGFKAKSHASANGYRYEIAAYRISRLLLLDNVPPTVFRRATRSEISSRFHPDKRDRWASVRRQISWEKDGTVVGAASYWIKGARRSLEDRKEAWQAWLQIENDIPPGRTSLARDLSTMMLFDFLIGNWDRFSGGNLLMNEEGTRAFLVDHDRAFSKLNEKVYRRLLEDLMRTERFSSTVVDRLLVLDEKTLEQELARDPSHAVQPLLSDGQIDAVLDRRSTILSHVASLIEEHGRQSVLFFP